MPINSFSKIMLFINSYTFFFIIIILKIWGNSEISCELSIFYTLLFGFIIVIALIFSILTIQSGMSSYDCFIKIKRLEESDINMLGYVFSYIVPFIDLDFSNIFDILIMAILITIIGYYYIKSNLFYLNPTLNLLGFKISKIKDGNNETVIIIYKKNKIQENTSIKAKMLVKNIFVGESNGKN